MMVTMRRKGEVLLIGDDIEITIVHIGHSRVRIGIRAPREYRVVPGEKQPEPPADPLERAATP